MEEPEQNVLTAEESVELVAQQMVRFMRDVEKRFEGVRSDFDVALLEQTVKLLERIEKVEKLLAETVGADMAERLLADLQSERT